MVSPRIAVLASGSGTTAESFIRSIANKEVAGEVVLVISNNKAAPVFERVEKLNAELGLHIKTLHIGKSNFPAGPDEKVGFGRQTKAEEDKILNELRLAKTDLVLLLGYMKLVGPKIVSEYGWHSGRESIYQAKMINTHPGLLPETKGLYGIHVQEKVLREKRPAAGHCLFVVDGEYDDGPVISEHKITVMPDDTPEQLFEKVKDSEKKNLARDIDKFIKEQQRYLRLQ
jgi:phosphoribosylglycinamide formyltransferase-1